MYTFDGKGALVVGAGGGIGGALAVELARRGARVAVADLDQAAAEQTAALIADRGGEAAALTCDVTDDGSVTAAVAQVRDFLGHIDLAANTAGVLLNGNPEDIPLTEWERIFRVNVFGATRLIHAVLPEMLARGEGYLLTTASAAGLYPFATSRIPYAASKAALISMTQNLAIYLRPQGIRVSCFCPGPVVTPIGASMKTWSEDVVMRGPGSHFKLMVPAEAAGILCDGMAAERFLIASHEADTLELLRQYAAAPDNFLYEKIGRFACGDSGLPRVDLNDPAIARAMSELGKGGG